MKHKICVPFQENFQDRNIEPIDWMKSFGFCINLMKSDVACLDFQVENEAKGSFISKPALYMSKFH